MSDKKNATECLLEGEPQRISGQVTGTVNGFPIDEVDLHAYVVTNDGRTYTAISRIPATVGYSLQSLYAVGSVLGFLFALPQQPMLHNGFTLTGIYVEFVDFALSHYLMQSCGC